MEFFDLVNIAQTFTQYFMTYSPEAGLSNAEHLARFIERRGTEQIEADLVIFQRFFLLFMVAADIVLNASGKALFFTGFACVFHGSLRFLHCGSCHIARRQ